MNLKDGIALAGAIGGGHFFEYLNSGNPYEIEDKKTGQHYEMEQPVLVLENGDVPRAFPIGENEADVICSSKVKGSGERALLCYRVFWNAAYENWDGSQGIYEVRQVEIFELGGEPRYRYKREGDIFRRVSI